VPIFERKLDRFWEAVGTWIVKRYVGVTIVCFTVIIFVGLGIFRTTSNVDIMKLFDDQARVRQDYRWLESNVGRLVPIEVVLKFNPDSLSHESEVDSSTDGANLRKGAGNSTVSLAGDAVPQQEYTRYSMLERAKTTHHVQRAIEAKFGAQGEDLIGRSISAVTFMPPLPSTATNARSFLRSQIFDVRLKRSLDELEGAGYLAHESDGSELWRISVRVAAFKDVDYAEFTHDLREVVSPINAPHNQRIAGSAGVQPISVVYTGVIPIIYKAQRALLDSLMEAAFWSFIAITPLLIIVSRGIKPGLVAMIPNTLPVIVVFGGLGWLDISITIGSMMSASIALGVAVDDTIHFLVWFREKLKENPDRKAAALAAYRVCATPTLQAAMISGLGLAVFGFSNFSSTKQFGLLMLTILLAGVVAELIMLPALLASPLGKVFDPRKSKPKSKKATEGGNTRDQIIQESVPKPILAENKNSSSETVVPGASRES